MFFQKLEKLKDNNKLKKISDIIDQFDFWLATRPKSYKDMLTPEQFAEFEEVIIEISQKLFEEAEKLKVIEKRYVLMCPRCFQVLSILNTKDDAIQCILEINENKEECNACEKYYKVTSNNVYIFYKLLEKPNKSEFRLSRGYADGIGIRRSVRTLTDEVLESPNENKSKYGEDIINRIMPEDLEKYLEDL